MRLYKCTVGTSCHHMNNRFCSNDIPVNIHLVKGVFSGDRILLSIIERVSVSLFSQKFRCVVIKISMHSYQSVICRKYVALMLYLSTK